MEGIAEAHRAVDTGHSRGMRVIQIAENVCSDRAEWSEGGERHQAPP